MIEIISKRDWDLKTFDTGKKEVAKTVFGSKLKNGLHDIEPDGSFVECDMGINAITNGVTTHQAKRGRYGELRFADSADGNKHLCKIKYKNGNGISFKYLGGNSSLPVVSNGKPTFTADNGVKIQHTPTYKGVKIELIIDDPLTAPLEYPFSMKTYGQDYIFTEENGGIVARGTDEKPITVHAPYAVDANGDEGPVTMILDGTFNQLQVFKKVVDETWLRQAASPVVVDPSVTIEDGVDGGVIGDSKLALATPDNNFGASNTYTEAAGGNIVSKVALTAYPNITVTLARFGYYISAATAPSTSWYEILKFWNEGNKSGTAATSDEVTWNSNRQDIETWTSAGCTGSGTDRNATAEGTLVVTAVQYNLFVISNTLAQKWIDNDVDNNGIVFDGAAGGAITFESTESSNPPFFYMEYTIGGGSAKRNLLLLHRRHRR